MDLFTDTTASLGAKLRVILQESDIRRLDLPLGIPATVGELEAVVRETFGITGNFVLHYKDVDFGEEYFSLNSTGELKDRDTIKVHIVEPPTVTLTFTDLDSSFGSASQISNPSSSAHTEVGSSSSCSIASQDTVILSSPEHGHRSQHWPTEFEIPRFAYDTELVLAYGNDKYVTDGTPFRVNAILNDVLEKLAESIYHYVAYPSIDQFSDVALALIQKHPCLKEPGSYNECYGWIQRLKYKMGNYRTCYVF